MNIRVDLNIPINDGTEVVFRSPVDCSQVTGLIVYYPANGNTISKEFAFADAHGNNVGDIDHLFTEDVVVKVILDVTKSMAFVQNADTNAYLEGRFDEKVGYTEQTFTEKQKEQARKNIGALGHEITKPMHIVSSNSDGRDSVIVTSKITADNDDMLVDVLNLQGNDDGHIDLDTVVLRGLHEGIADNDAVNKGQMDRALSASELAMVDKLCPTFTESGAVVTCEPVEGYPLTVTAEEGATITRCGKNLFNYRDWIAYLNQVQGNALEEVEYLGRNCFAYRLYRTDITKFFTNIRFKPNTQYTFKLEAAFTYEGYETYPNMRLIAIMYDDGSASTYAEYPSLKKGEFTTITVTSAPGKTISQLTVPKFSAIATVYIPIDSCVIMEGTTAEYVPYTGETFAQGEQIPAVQGINNLWADSGEITVSGKADPVARLERLENAILAMGANV